MSYQDQEPAPQDRSHLKGLPSAPDTERAILSCCLRWPDEAIATTLEAVGDDCAAFYIPSHQTLFAAIVGLWRVKGKFDIITLNQSLTEAGEIDAVGGSAAVAELLDEVPTIALLNHYLTILRDKATRRILFSDLNAVAIKCIDDAVSPSELLDEAEAKLFEIRNFANDSKRKTGLIPAEEHLPEVVAELEHAFANRGQTTRGIRTGFPSFDRMTMGLAPGAVYIIAARPSMGKTALAMNMAENIALDDKTPTGVFTLEMSATELLKRTLAGRAGVNIYNLRDGFLKGDGPARLHDAARSIVTAGSLYIDDSGGLTIQDLRSRARQAVARYGLKCIVIDYLQLLKSSSKMAQTSRYVEVGEVSRGLKAMAKELDIPLIVLAQLNRAAEQRKNNEPKLSDLRESGDIEQDADLIALLYRRGYYLDRENAAGESDPDHDSDFDNVDDGSADLIIAKQRNGPVGTVKLKFDKEAVKFSDPSPELYDA